MCSGSIQNCERQTVLPENFLNEEYGRHKLQAMIFWVWIQGMNQQNFVTIHLNIPIWVLNDPFLQQCIMKLTCSWESKNWSRCLLLIWFRLKDHISSNVNWTKKSTEMFLSKESPHDRNIVI